MTCHNSIYKPKQNWTGN